ncbi:hypothetical protein PENTCL1PPCAC_10357, partial [Pristionchus entomophagus]
LQRLRCLWMTLCVVSSNEDAQLQSQGSTTNTMEATSSMETQSQDSGYASQPHSSSSSATKYLGQNLRITACANQGGRKYMEDRVHVHVHRCAVTGAVDWTYVAVYDGHGGPEASEYCRQHLLKNIQAEKDFDSENDDEFLEAIRSGFLKTHHTMWKEVDNWERTASGYPSTAGTTASCAFIRRGKLYVGHVGDSAILLTTRSDPELFYRLTEDHKPESHVEKKRIEASGGHVLQKSSVYRVVWTRATLGHVGPIRRTTPTQTIPFLAVARSLGDFWSYVEETQEFAVSPIPDVSVTELTPDHYSIVLASDGLTNVLSAGLESAVMYELAAEEQQRRWFTNPDEHPNPARILMRKTMLAWRRFRADNVSVVSVIFDDEPSASQSIADEEDNQSDEGTVNSTSDLPVELPKETSLDEQLAEHPLCMLHVTNDKLVRYQTAPVVMRYNGAFDNNFCTVDSVGPGFVSHDTERASMMDLFESAEERTDKLEQYYDLLGVGERDVTPENQPPPTSTKNLINRAVGAERAEKRTSMVFTSAAAIIIDELRREGESVVAGAHAAAATVAAAAGAADDTSDRPCTPDNRPGVGQVALRTSRSTSKRKSRIFTGTEEPPRDDKEEEEESAANKPSTSAAAAEATDAAEDDDDVEADVSMVEEESESESSSDDDGLLKLALPFADEVADQRREASMRTPSPIGDDVEGRHLVCSTAVRGTPPCNTTSTEREMVRRVTRSAAATTSSSSKREMVLVDRPATRRHSSRLLDFSSSLSSSPAPRTPKMVLQVEDTPPASIASRTRSHAEEVTPPASLSAAATPSVSVSGSRKRPRTAMMGAPPGTTAATPLLAKISLAAAAAEMNENAESSMESEEAAAPSEKRTPSKWKRSRQPLGSSTRSV